MKKIVIILILVALLGAGLTAFLLSRSRENVIQYKTEKISRGDIQETVFASGTINAITTVSVGTQVSGRIKAIYVDFNSPVKEGQLIAKIDPSIFEAQLEQARANLILARANLEKAQASLNNAKREFDRANELWSKNLIAKSEMDSAETNYLTAKANLSAASAELIQASAGLKSAQTNLKYTDIVSPVDGVVISRNVDVGQTVAASFQTPTLFLIAQDLTKMQIDTNVNEADIGKITVGQEVEFTVDAYPEITFKGKVYQVRNAPIIVSNVVTYDVVIRVDNPDLKLKPGMTANTTIITAYKNNILRIPNAALRFVPPKQTSPKLQKGYGVWIIQNQEPVRIPVTIGISDDSWTELVSGDLKEGQEVIIGEATKAKAAPPPHGPGMF